MTKKHIFCFGIILAAITVIGFLLITRMEYEEVMPRADCSYWEALAIYQGIQDITNVSVFDLARETYGNVWHIEDGLARKVTYNGEAIYYL